MNVGVFSLRHCVTRASHGLYKGVPISLARKDQRKNLCMKDLILKWKRGKLNAF